MTNEQQTHIKLVREQRASYFAWQNATPGDATSAAIAQYEIASKRLKEFNAAH